MAAPNRRSMRLIVAMAVLLGCVGCDQLTKQIATETLRGRPPLSYCANTVCLQYALNRGGFLSLGANLAPVARFWMFTALNTAFLALLVYALATRWSTHLATFLALVLLLAGGLSNQVDRVCQNGLVTDFICLGIGPLRTGIFNVADVALTGGALLLLVTVFRPKAEPDSHAC